MKKIITIFAAICLSGGSFAAGHIVTATSVPVSCFGSCDGMTMSNVSGGVGPFTYSWSPSGGTSTGATGLCAGNYTVTVTDNNDMSTATATVSVTSPAVLTVGMSSSYVTCAGGCATLNPMVSGGTAGYTFSWTGGLFGSMPSACPSGTTSYTVTVTDANACVATGTTTVTVNPLPTVTVPSTYTTCLGGCVGFAASATGGSAFMWSPATALSTTATANPICCPTATTTYTVVATYGGCTASAVTTVNIGTTIISGLTSTNTSGCVTCDGSAVSVPTGGSSPYVYNWSTGATTASINTLCAGSYSVTVTDAMGCSIIDSTIVFANGSSMANFTMVPDSTNAYVFQVFNSSVGGAGSTYSWSFPGGVPSTSTSSSPIVTFSSPGVYNVCLIVSNFLCGADTLCQPVTVTGTLASCLALFNVGDDTANPDPNAHYVYNLSYGATLSYLWDFGDGSTSTSATPSHVYAGTGPYLLCLSVNNGSGCTDMYCDSLFNVDSINRDGGTMQLTVFDGSGGLVTGIQYQENSGGVSVAPNPFTESTVFTVDSQKEYSFELMDVLGKKVMSLNGLSDKQLEVSRGQLQNGIYFYKIYTTDGIVGNGKVIIR